MSEGKIGGRLCVRVNLGGYEHIEVEQWDERAIPRHTTDKGYSEICEILRADLVNRITKILTGYLSDKELNERRDAMPGQMAIYYKSKESEGDA